MFVNSFQNYVYPKGTLLGFFFPNSVYQNHAIIICFFKYVTFNFFLSHGSDNEDITNVGV